VYSFGGKCARIGAPIERIKRKTSRFGCKIRRKEGRIAKLN